VKTALEAGLQTKSGKKLKEQGLKMLLGRKGLPFTFLVGTAALAGMIANNTDIPSVPEIPLSDNLSIKVEFEGKWRKPTGVKFVLKFTFGGPKVQKVGRKEKTVLALPKELHAYIDRIDRDTLVKWFVQRALYEWEVAGPDSEERALAFYQAARDRPHSLGLPDTRLMATEVSRKLVEAAIQNRVNQLQGREVHKQLAFDLGHAHQFDRLSRLDGLGPRLEWALNLLVPVVPYKALGIEQVAFTCGTKHAPVVARVKR
jgi:hypothetical protein